MIKRKKIMILGAGVYQVPLIKKAKKMGLETLVVSIAGKYPGIALADHFFEINTTDINGVVAIAKEQKISAVITTGSDVCMQTLGAVVDELKLPGPSRNVASTVSSKTNFRKFLHANNLNSPDYKKCADLQDLLGYYKKKSNKIVIKPDDSSGSRGVEILNPHLNHKSIEKAYNNAVKYSSNGVVCAEGFISGNEVGGDAFFYEGRLLFFTTTYKHMNGVLVNGHSLPGSLENTVTSKVKNELQRIAGFLGYKNGPMNFDVMITSDDVFVLEVGLRNGGNGIPDLIYRCYGVDLVEILLNYSLKIPVSLPEKIQQTEISSYIFGSQICGILKKISSFEELKSAVPEVCSINLAIQLGQTVKSFYHNANLIGYVIFRGNYKNYNEICLRIANALNIEVI